MTGIEIRDSGDGIWDDGEWISWAWINTHIEPRDDGPLLVEEDEEAGGDDGWEPSAELLWRILNAKNHFEHTLNEISPDWGGIGESYIAERFGVTLCSRNVAGHDGRLGDELIEIKTITPHKQRAFVTVKRAGNFSILAVVKITPDSQFEARFIRRADLPKGDGGKRIVITWQAARKIGALSPPRRGS